MPREQQQRLQQTLWDLQKRYGDRAIGTLADTPLRRGISTGFAALDAVLSRHGLPRGRMTTLVGENLVTAGMTSLAYSMIAQAQREAPVVYLDSSATLDADYAARCGMALERLLVVRGLDLVQALSLIRDVLAAGNPSLIMLDAAAVERYPPLTQVSMLLQRVSEPLSKSGCAVLFLPPPDRRLAPVINETTDTALQVRRSQWLRRGRDIVGYSVEVTILKDKERSGEQRVALEMITDCAADGDSL